MVLLTRLLEQSARYHRHLCPRQVLGVRMGLLAGQVLGLTVPQAADVKRIFTIVETDGCGADGVSVAVNCWIGRRTLRVEDFGKVAATFVDTQTGRAVRIVPQYDARQKAYEYTKDARNKWEAMLLGYQHIPALDLLKIQPVVLRTPLEDLLGRPGLKTQCENCGEEIINGREVEHFDQTQCRACAGYSYYASSPEIEEARIFAHRRLDVAPVSAGGSQES